MNKPVESGLARMHDVATRLALLDADKRMQLLKQLHRQGVVLGRLPILPRRRERAQLSYAQRRLWFLWRLEPTSAVYNMPVVLRLDGALDMAALQASFDALAERHEGLRSRFGQDGDEPWVEILPPTSVRIEQVVVADQGVGYGVGDGLGQSPGDGLGDGLGDCLGDCLDQSLDHRLNALIDAEARRPFDLERGPVLRVVLYREAADRHVLQVTLHHIVADAWSLSLLAGEFARLYEAQVSARAAALPALPVQYADYADWQRELITAGEGDRQLDYWKAALAGEQNALDLPLDRQRPPVPDHAGDAVSVRLAPDVVQRLSALARARGMTLSTLALAAYVATLYRHTGNTDPRVGVPLANRNRAETEHLLGFFVNMIVLRVRADGATALTDLADTVHAALIAAQDNQDVPFERLVEELAPQRSTSHSPLFQVVYNHQPARRGALRAGPLTLTPVDRAPDQARFELALDTAEEEDGSLTAMLGYATGLFERATVQALARHWTLFMQALAADPSARLRDVALLDDDARQRLAAWARGVDPSDTDAGPWVHQCFAEQARAQPDHPALVFADRTWRYAELDRLSDQYAQQFLAQGLGPERRAAVVAHRDARTIAAFIGLLKAGAAYVPLDPAHPPARWSRIARAAGVSCVFSSDEAALAGMDADIRVAGLPPDAGVALGAGGSIGAAPVSPANGNGVVALHPQSLAYVIYTSGSTGEPKGVAVPHGPLAMHCRATAHGYGMSSATRELHFLSLAFDGAHERLLTALSVGATLIMRDGTLWEPAQTLRVLAEQRATHAGFPPAYLLQLARHAHDTGVAPPMQVYSFGGEAMPRAGFELVKQALRPQVLINGYGPTETVVTPMLWRVDAGAQCDTAYAPIGQPVGERRAYVLDADLNVAPPGVPGELYVGGVGLARGYWDRAGATAERFVPDPQGEPGARLYRTGDMVRWRADGVMEYLGRLDHQIKIRGFRIEPGEIEAALLALPGVKQAIAVPQATEKGHRLLAYVGVGGTAVGEAAVGDVAVGQTAEGDIAASQPALDESGLRQALAATLPDYMLPARIVVLMALPLTPTGKVDRAALPEPAALAHEGRAPESAAERALALIWREVLGVGEVQADDNFFALGGDSIVSLQLVGKARQAGWELSARDVFQHQTLAELAGVAKPVASGDADGPARLAGEGELELLPIQRSFFQQSMARPSHWNQSVLLRVHAPLDGAALRAALTAVLAQHEALRLRFDAEGRAWHGTVDEADAVLWERDVEAAGMNSDALLPLYEAAQRSLSLEDGPVLRVVWARVADGEERLLLVAHHLVIDGVSWRVLLGDLQQGYRQALAGEAVQLDAPSQSYKGWSQALWAQADAPQTEADYWRTQRGAPGDVPCDYPAGSATVADEAQVTVRLDAARTQQLLRDTSQAYRTQINDLLLTALLRAMDDWRGAPSAVTVGLEGHGRDAVPGQDASRTIGWFTTLYPLRLNASGPLDAAIKQVKEQLRAVPAGGAGYGVLCAQEDLARGHLPQGTANAEGGTQSNPSQRSAAQDSLANLTADLGVIFNYLGQFDASFGEDALWSPAVGEQGGATRDAQAPLGARLVFNGRVYEGELSLTISYSAQQYDASRVAALASAYERELCNVIAHCVNPASAGITPSDVPLSGLTQTQLDALRVPASLIEDIYGLSPMQQGLYFHAQNEPGTALYVNQLTVPVTGLDADRLVQAWQTVTARHAILRSGFEWPAGASAPVQIVRRTVQLPVRVEDWRKGATARGAAADSQTAQANAAADTRQAAALAALALEERARGFDLAQAPLQRLALIRTSDTQYHLIWTHHHILLDGWSAAALMAEVLRVYRGETLAAPTSQFRDYIAWLADRHADADHEFWHPRLAALDEPTLLANAIRPPQPAASDHSLSPSRDPDATPCTGHGVQSAHLDDNVLQRLTQYAQRERITLNTLVQGAWTLLLQRYTGQPTVAFGATVAGRPETLHGAQDMLGLFINTVPVIQSPHPSEPAAEWLRRLQDDNAQLREAGHVPLYEIQRWADRPGQALFDSIVVFENYPVDAALRQRDPADPVFGDSGMVESTSYACALTVRPQQGLALTCLYQTATFDGATVTRLLAHLGNLLRAWADAAPQTRVADVAMLDAHEHRQETEQRQGQLPAAAALDFIETVAQQASQRPAETALTWHEQIWTYDALTQRAAQIATMLHRRGVGADDLVGLNLERGPGMVTAMLGVLWAGAAYVPLDPALPQARRDHIIRDAGIRCLLVDRADAAASAGLQGDGQRSNDSPGEASQLDRSHLDYLALDQIAADTPYAARAYAHPEQLAYVLYTSGSTGTPKGVAMRRGALSRLLAWQAQRLPGAYATLQFAAYGFDVSFQEVFSTWTTGGNLVIAPDAARHDFDRLGALLRDAQIGRIYLPFAVLQALAEALHSGRGATPALRQIITAGEQLKLTAAVLAWLAATPGCKLYNQYGPTESHVISQYEVDERDAMALPPIGTPIAGSRLYVRDAWLAPAPQGVNGALYLAGESLARGYHRRPALTAERFVPDPDGAPGARMYLSGDVAAWRDDGELAYLGRSDHQVKIRGHRVELGEIESRLLELAGVRDAVVVTWQQAQSRVLVAYVVQDLPDEALSESLKSALRASLPDYMVPTHIIVLPALPLTRNGKVDRAALPEPQRTGSAAELQAGVESTLAALWQSVLGVEQVGPDDNFFALGGDSIVSIQLTSRAREQGIQISPRDVFEQQTLRGLAAVAGVAQARAERGPAQGEARLLPIQRWFFDMDMPNRAHWNQSVWLEAVEPIDATSLRRALAELIAHHDALRLRYRESGAGQWTQRYAAIDAPAAEAALWVRECPDAAAEQAVADEAQRSLDLAQGPLLRAVLMQRPGQAQRLLLVIHHLVVDGVSWRVLLEDAQRLYRAQRSGAAVTLPARSSAVSEWAEAMAAHAASASVQAQLPAWLAVTRDVPELARDRAVAPGVNADAGSVTFTLSPRQTQRLLGPASQAYRTQVNDLLLAALGMAATQWANGSPVLVDLEGHGREEQAASDLDLSRTVGWFATMFPLRLDPQQQPGPAIKAVKEGLRAMPDKGLGYWLLKFFDATARQALEAQPQARIAFNYLGQFDQSFGADALWRPVGEAAGAEVSPDAPLRNWIMVGGLVYEGQLKLSLSYSRLQFDAARIEALAQAYEAALESVIAHCCEAGAQGVAGITPSDFPLAGLTQTQLDALSVPAADIEDIYGLSPMQQGMLFYAQSEPGTELYVNQLRVPVSGLDPARLVRAWETVTARHAVLRSGFEWPAGARQPVQVVRRAVSLPVQLLDHRGDFETDTDARLASVAAQERARGFDLAQAPLQRLALIRLEEDRYHLIWTHHHILMDGWSAAALMAEVLRAYRGEALPAPSGQFRDYLGWLARRDPDADAAFWHERLAGLDEPTLLANAVRPPQGARSGHGTWRMHLPPVALASLTRFAQRERITLNTLVQGAWTLLLQRYTGQSAVAFGATVAGRPDTLPGAAGILGLFINTVPVIQSPAPSARAGAWLRRLQEDNARLREAGHVPLYDIQRWAGRPGQALFDSIVVFENYPVDAALRQRAADDPVFGQVASTDRTNYPLTVVVEAGDGLSLGLGYQRASFDDAQARQLGEGLVHLLQALAADGECALGALSLVGQGGGDGVSTLPGASRDEYAAPFTAASYHAASPTPCLHESFEDWAARKPQATALVMPGEESLSYAQLNQQANRLAWRLKALGVGPEHLVGVTLPRGVAMVVTLLAILKAGGAYLPLDPIYPQARRDAMLTDSGARVLIALPDTPAPTGVQVLAPLDNSEGRDDNPPHQATPANLAYCIYTSGSTGQPKGALLTHRNASRLLAVTAADFAFGPDDRWTLFHSYAFDFSVWEIFGALCQGGRLIVVPQAVSRSPEAFVDLLRSEGVTVLNQTPSAFRQLLDVDALYTGGPLALRHVIFGGEALEVSSLARWFDHFGDAQPRLVNMYGITETTVHVTFRPITQADLADTQSSPMGAPLSDLTLSVLDTSMHPAPAGMTGELYVGGDGLARGYLGRPALTAQRFVPDPDSAEPGARRYRTGDLARQRPDGDLEYLGRIDHQLKIRGFRIELGEIEARLRLCAGVKDAVVIARRIGSSLRLLAYVVGTAEAVAGQAPALDPADLRRQLTEGLPDYMVPAHITVLDGLPLTVNGKLDRAALPDPQTEGHSNEAPSGEAEVQLAEIWRDLLGAAHVGALDNFFELGGDSIQAMQVASRARAAGLALTPRDLFEHQTLRAVAAAARTQADAPAAPASSDGVSLLGKIALPQADLLADAYALSPMQLGMLFHTQQDPEEGLYVNTLSLGIDGLDRDRFVAAWRDALARHDTLRTAFLPQDGAREAVQVVRAHCELPLTELDWRGRDVSAQALEALARDEKSRGFDIGQAPLWRLLLVRLDTHRYHLIWTHHHLLIDGWSTAVLMAEVLRAYRGEALTDAPGSYRDYIAWLQAQDPLASERFWRERLAPLEEATLLAATVRAPREQSGHGQCYTRLDASATAALQQFAQRERVTLNTLVQGAWVLLLQRYTGQQTVAFGATVAGRPESLANAQRMLGLFINTVPVIQSPTPATPVGDWLRGLQRENARVREQAHAPLYDIQRWSGRPGQPLFDSIIVFENYPVDQALREHGQDLRFTGVGASGFTNYAMDLAVIADNGALTIEYSYLQASFSAAQVQGIRLALETLLAGMAEDASRAVGRLPLAAMPQAAAVQPPSATDYPADVCVHRLIERQARHHPARVAVEFEGRSLRYGELNRKANRVAHWLLQRPETLATPLAVYAQRSPETLALLLGVLKAGGCYVPVDPAYPVDRQQYLLQDSGARLLLAAGDTPPRLSAHAEPVGLDQAALADQPDTDPNVPLHTHSLAYVIYTSGSTGKPKGVAVAHGPLSMHCQATADVYGIDSDSCELHFLSLAFDGAHERWLTPMIRGARVVLSAPELWTPEQTCAALHAHGVTHAGFPPAYLQQVADWVETQGNPPPVQLYSFGGEAMPRAGFERIRRILKPRWMINGYGPTETVISPLVWKVAATEECDCAYAPIGQPVGARRIAILDDCLHPLPAGVAGELYIGGLGVARGYWEQPGLTALRFVPDPDDPGARLYRTGDVVRQREDGSLEFVGRADQQIKIRGFRVEPGEIEARLREHPQVRDAVVMALAGEAGTRLVAYVVAGESAGVGGADAGNRALREPALSESALRAYVGETLPEYMVPAHVVCLPRLPVLPSGKLDRKALPAPTASSDTDGYDAPRTPQEQALANIWQDVLGVARVGITDNFYALGGDSLLSLKVIARLRAAPELGLDIKLRDLMRKPRIVDLLEAVATASAAGQDGGGGQTTFAAGSAASVAASAGATPVAGPAANQTANPDAIPGATQVVPSVTAAGNLAIAGSAATTLATSDDNVLPMNAAAAGQALFCIHPGFGTVFDYEPVARRLAGRRPVYGIQSRMLLDPDWRDASLPAMAADYAAQIRRIQPQGPYALLGWSLGGTLAAGIAAELERTGESVSLLGMIDPYVPGAPSLALAPARTPVQQLATFLTALFPTLAPADIQAQAERAFGGVAQDEGTRTNAAEADAALADAAQTKAAQAHTGQASDPAQVARAIDALSALVQEVARVAAHSDPDRSADAANPLDAGGLGGEELAHVYSVTSHLLALAEASPPLAPVKAAPHVWWIANREDDALALERQLGVPPVAARVVGDHHYAIMRDARLKADLELLLLGPAAAAATATAAKAAAPAAGTTAAAAPASGVTASTPARPGNR